MIPKIPFILLMALCSVTAYTQEYYVQIEGKERGLGMSSISALIEDHEGMVWIGTQLGLLRFDGLQSYPYLPEKGNANSLSNEYINDLFEDDRYNIWVATRNGLNKIDPSRKVITHYFHDTEDSTSIPGNGIYSLTPASDSSFFVICARAGFAEFNIHTGKIRRLDPVLSSDPRHLHYGDRFITSTWRTPKGDIFLRTNNGTFHYNQKENIIEDVVDTIAGFDYANAYPNLCLTREGVIWFSGWNGNLYKWSPYQYLLSYCDSLITTAFETGETVINDFDQQHILISSPQHLLLVEKESGDVKELQVREDQRTSFAGNVVRNCIQTSKGIVLLATSQGNLVILDPLRQQFRYKPILVTGTDGTSLGEISDIFEDTRYQKRFISSLADTFFYVENLVTHQVMNVRKNKIGNTASRWMMDQEGRLWLCDGNAILEVNRIDYSTTSYSPDTATMNLSDMIEIKPGVMLTTSFRGGLFRFEPDRHIFTKIPNGKGWKQPQITCLAFDKAHQSAWIGTTDNGLYRYDVARDTFLHYTHFSRNPNSLGGDWIRDITFDSLGFAWFATEPIGVSRFDYSANPDSAFLNITMSEGLPSSYISGLCTDKKGHVWMTSLNGIVDLDPKDFSIRQFRKVDGLPTARFTKSCITVTPDNWILVGSRNGYFYFNPNRLLSNRNPPDIVVRDILVLNKSRLTAVAGHGVEPIRLRYNENYLTIQFSVINFTDPERNTVKYMLEGLEDQWNLRTGISEINYTKIPPGDYRFRILAANNDGTWNYKETVIPFIISPAFWQTTWFYILIGAAIASLIFAFYNFKLKQSIKQNRLIAEKEFVKSESERQLSQLEMTALRAQMNPHFVFNCLNSINRFIVINDNEAASEYLTKFSKLIRQVLDNSRGEKVLLATEIDTLKLYIDMESLRFIDKFEYTITVNPDLEPSAWVIQPMLVQPYVENAIWHGLMHRRTKGILQIYFSRKGDSLAVTIEDNGVGREMAKQIKESQLVTRKSHGMKVTAQRMALLSKKLNVTVEAFVEDLYDDEHQARGTCVHLTLPLEPANNEVNPKYNVPS